MYHIGNRGINISVTMYSVGSTRLIVEIIFQGIYVELLCCTPENNLTLYVNYY